MVCDTVTIQEAAALAVASIDVPSTVTVGSFFRVRAVVENTGDVDGSGTVVFTQDGSEFERISITVPANSSRTVDVSHSIGTAGGYSICAEMA